MNSSAPALITTDRPVDLWVAALEACANTAERGERPEGVVCLDASDFARVEVAKVRATVERVLMGRHPDLGLDMLLEVGARSLTLNVSCSTPWALTSKTALRLLFARWTCCLQGLSLIERFLVWLVQRKTRTSAMTT